MWLFTTQGFYSVVAHRNDAAKVIVRARAREDLEALKNQIPSLRIFEDAEADYRYRAVVDHEKWVAAVAILAAGIDYPNFKSAVAERQGIDRERVYMRVWAEMLGIQEGAE
ncbi:MAG: hypothetical protein ACR2G3_11685 [Solirubrobacterales bacterium]